MAAAKEKGMQGMLMQGGREVATRRTCSRIGWTVKRRASSVSGRPWSGVENAQRAVCSGRRHSPSHTCFVSARDLQLPSEPEFQSSFDSSVHEDSGENELTRPSPGFAPVQDALKEIANGKFVVVLDDEDRENEGDLIMAAEKVTESDMAFMVNNTSGLICVGMEGKDLDRLDLPLMVDSKNSSESMGTAFTVSVDASKGTSTGISAADRCATIRTLAKAGSRPEDFRKPGHVFPLRAREGGVLKRAGHTEAAVDLAKLSDCFPAGVLCEIVNPDGTMARGQTLLDFAKEHGLLAISISDLMRYRRQSEALVDRVAVARLPTTYGVFQAYSYRAKSDGIEHLALVYGDVKNSSDVLVRVHSECLTGDILGSLRCDCGPQLGLAMKKVVKEGCGVIVYLRGHEGRGIGLGHKLKAYNLQDAGRDTVEANVDLGLPVDSREYGIGAHILRDVGVRTLRLMTNNPAKYTGLKGYGLEIVKRVPLLTPINKENKKYIMTKVHKMGHWYGGEEEAPEATAIRSDAGQ